MSETKEKQTIQPEDLFRLKALTTARLSPDGCWIIYGISQVDTEKEEESADLWLYNLEKGQTRQLTAGKGMDHSPVWSPDGQEIAFVSTRTEKPQIYLISPFGGEARQLTKMKNGVGEGPSWSPDGKLIAFTSTKEVELPDRSKPYRITRCIYRFDGVGYLDGIVQDIYTISAEGGESQQLTDDLSSNGSLQWSPDGEKILYLARMNPDTYALAPVLRCVNLNNEVQDMLDGWGSISSAQWLKDSEGILFTGQIKGTKEGSKTDLWVLPKIGEEPFCRTKGLDAGVCGGLQGDFPTTEFQGRLILSENGDQVYLSVQKGGELGIYLVNLSGEEAWLPVLSGERLAALHDLQADKLLYTVSDMHEPGDLYLCDLQGKNEKRLTSMNQEIVDEWLLSEVEHLLFKGAQGDQVEGWLMKPAVGEAPWPTVLYIHGGPTGAFGHVFTFDFQMLAGAGYAVLFINPHGSSGYDDDFATAIIGDWGGPDYEDMITAVDFVIEKGWADADKLGVAGLSYGGYMTTWIISQTQRFKAAVPENPVTNLYSMYGTSDISPDVLKEAMGGLPHEVPEVYTKCSPITYAHQCTTPTLLIQGESDFRCPAEQSEQYYTVLKANGCVAEMLRLPGGSHIGSIMGDPLLRKAQNEALLDWMGKYLNAKCKE